MSGIPRQCLHGTGDFRRRSFVAQDIDVIVFSNTPRKLLAPGTGVAAIRQGDFSSPRDEIGLEPLGAKCRRIPHSTSGFSAWLDSSPACIINGANTAEQADSVNRSTLKPTIALLLAILFLLTTAGEGFGASGCPHHEAAPQTRGAALEDPGGMHEHEHGHAPADAAPNSHQHDAAPCSCIGGCLPGVAGSLPLPTVTVEFAPAHVVETSVLASGAAAPRASLLPHVLPFAQAPPAA